ncbi:MAG: type I-E CRISPR-associated protein Cas6/Cse3/CasE [Cellvibrionaceae bacterium]|nr:type I-E CRISPR-associated protein Cas6/Cse3/CasE [Cellvibrionaceae bacterium]
MASAIQIIQSPLARGQKFAFDLRANPVVAHSADGKSRRDDVVMHRKKQLLSTRGLSRWADWDDADTEKPLLYEIVQDTCTQWLMRRSEACGFRLIESNDEKQLRVDGYLQQRADKKGIRFSTVDFSGVLEVTDPGRFQKALCEGIGKAKAFGCGLLLIRRI